MGFRKDVIVVKAEELRRYQLVGKIFDKSINQQKAAELLGVSNRQMRRIVRRVRVEGERGIAHRSRGRKGQRRISDSVRSKILALYRKRYQGFGPTLASEKLLELNHVRVSDETLRLWLIAEGLWTTDRRRKLKERSWRARKDRFGEMVQMDGSHHAWLEDRGPKLVLMGYIDDATSTFHGKFFEYEGTKPAMGGLRSYAEKYGIPCRVYLDRHSTYKVNRKKRRCANWVFEDKESLTQFERACRQLGMEVIHANSPQAKGRIERVFRTLQDRLVKEMRLRGIKTLDEANRFLEVYLPKFNAKFTVEAQLAGDVHRPVDKSVKINEILSVQVEHALRNDRTVLHNRKLYQVLKTTSARRVVVFEYLNGEMAVKHNGVRLAFKPIDQRPTLLPKSPRPFKTRYSQKKRKLGLFRCRPLRLIGRSTSLARRSN